MGSLKISVCITLKDVSDSVGLLINNLLKQSLPYDEMVVVDGGSRDNTLQILNHYQKKDKRIKLIKLDCGISKGRNLAIDASRGEIIVLTDAGCIPEKDWLLGITEPFKNNQTEMVSGFYNMSFKNNFQEALRLYMGIVPERLDVNKFIPSARSVAFRKSVWEKEGGFNESLEKSGEDTEYFIRLIKSGVKNVCVPGARVEWGGIIELDIKRAYTKFRNYAMGDALSNVWIKPGYFLMSHNIKIILIFIRYILFLLILLFSVRSHVWIIPLTLLLLYLIWPIYKWRDVKKSIGAIVLLPFVQILSDIAVMDGFLHGIYKRLQNKFK